jgi:hypothetical protein
LERAARKLLRAGQIVFICGLIDIFQSVFNSTCQLKSPSFRDIAAILKKKEAAVINDIGSGNGNGNRNGIAVVDNQ